MKVMEAEPEVTAWFEDGSAPPCRGWWEVKAADGSGTVYRAWYEPETNAWSRWSMHYALLDVPPVWRGLAKPPPVYPKPYELI